VARRGIAGNGQPARAAAAPAADAGVRDRIMDTAARLFYQDGIQAVGVQRLIEEAGVAKASLYAHFPSKDDLVVAYLDRKGAAWRDAARAHLDNPRLSARGKLLKMFDLLVDMVEEPGFRGCPYQNAGGEVGDPHHPIKEAGRRQRAWIHDTIGRLVKAAGAPSPERLTGSLIVLYDGAAATALLDGDPSSARHARWAAGKMLNL
jgi:AcrR family transcriptional regulator